MPETTRDKRILHRAGSTPRSPYDTRYTVKFSRGRLAPSRPKRRGGKRK